jgi:hypothetical protein
MTATATATRRVTTLAALPSTDWSRRPASFTNSWEHRSACYNRPEAWWDGDDAVQAVRARQACLSCPVLQECLAAQMDAEESVLGSQPMIRGGLTGPERAQLLLDERIDGAYDAEEARLLALEAGAYGKPVAEVAESGVSVVTLRLAGRLAGEVVPDAEPGRDALGPSSADDTGEINDYLAGGLVRLTHEQQLAAIAEGLRRKMTYLDIDRVRGQSPNTTAQFVSRMRKKYVRQGLVFPVVPPSQGLLTDAQVLQIRQRYARGGVTHEELGLRYGVTRKVIGSVITGLTYKHVGGPLAKGRGKSSEKASREMNRSLNVLALGSSNKKVGAAA